MRNDLLRKLIREMVKEEIARLQEEIQLGSFDWDSLPVEEQDVNMVRYLLKKMSATSNPYVKQAREDVWNVNFMIIDEDGAPAVMTWTGRGFAPQKSIGGAPSKFYSPEDAEQFARSAGVAYIKKYERDYEHFIF